MGLLSSSCCIWEPNIECFQVQCRFWRAGMPTWVLRPWDLVKESGILPHLEQAAN